MRFLALRMTTTRVPSSDSFDIVKGRSQHRMMLLSEGERCLVVRPRHPRL